MRDESTTSFHWASEHGRIVDMYGGIDIGFRDRSCFATKRTDVASGDVAPLISDSYQHTLTLISNWQLIDQHAGHTIDGRKSACPLPFSGLGA